MKKLLLSSLVALSFFQVNAQTWAFATLDINQAKAGINSNGDLFWNYSNPQFEIPQDSGAHVIFAGAMWLGGLDSGNAIHIAAQTYRQTGSDFYPGPKMNSGSYSVANDLLWNKTWKINKTTIDTFLMWRANPGNFPGYTIPSVLTSWPGNGDVQQGQSAQLAPFIDVNSDGVYDPNSGDYPCIKGDQAVLVIFNDDRNTHGETGGAKLGVEVHLMMYAYKAPGTWLDSTIFSNYKIYNHSNSTYSETYLGMFHDFDLGDYSDDFVGCDVGRNIAYVYNGDANDGSSPIPTTGTFGANPPAEGIVFLAGPLADVNDNVDNDRDGVINQPGETCLMNRHTYYNNNFNATGNPVNDTNHYDYLAGFWLDGSPVTYGGTGYGGSTPADFMFPGDTDPTGWGTNFVPQLPWDETSSGNLPSDRRSLSSSGPFTLEAGSMDCIDFAYVFGRGNNGPLSSVAVMQNIADSAHAFYANNNPCTCDPNPLGVNEQKDVAVGIYPNPATDQIKIICGDNSTGAQIEIVDATGKLVHTSTVLSGNSAVVDTSDFSKGIYFVRINKGSVVLTGKFIRN